MKGREGKEAWGMCVYMSSRCGGGSLARIIYGGLGEASLGGASIILAAFERLWASCELTMCHWE